MSYLLNDAQDPRGSQVIDLSEQANGSIDLSEIVNQAISSNLVVEPVTINLTPATPQDKIGLGGDVLAERGKQWGDAYKQISGDWEELLGIKTTTEQFIAMMIVLKLRRWRNSGYTEKDCLTDIIGYAKLGLS